MDSIKFPIIKFPIFGILYLAIFLFLLIIASMNVRYSIMIPTKSHCITDKKIECRIKDKSSFMLLKKYDYLDLFITNTNTTKKIKIREIHYCDRTNDITILLLNSKINSNESQYNAIIINGTLWKYLCSNIFSKPYSK